MEGRKMTPAEKVEVLRAACCVAGANRETVESESVLLNKLAREIGVGQASLGAMISRSQEDDTFHQDQFRILKSDPPQTMAILIEVAMADGSISDREQVVLENMASNLGVTPEVTAQLLQAGRDSLESDPQ